LHRPRRQRLGCLECDLLLTLGELGEGERALCPRCGHLLASHPPDGFTRSIAYALAAAVLLVMANAFPFLALEASGRENVMTLPRAAAEIWRDGYEPMAVLVMLLIVVVPALMIGLLVALMGSLLRGRGAEWQVPAGKLLFWLTPWSMVEVFVIGVLVSLVKVGELATVVIGFSFWSYVAFALCFIAALASLDRLTVWQEIERCNP
jgi:paraquat-inducible protein A